MTGGSRAVLLAAVVLAAACSGGNASSTTTAPRPETAPTTTQPTGPPTTAAAASTTRPPPGPEQVLNSFFGAIAAGDDDAAVSLLAPDAVWSFPGIDVRLGEPLPPEMAWLAEATGGAAEATGDAVVANLLRYLVELETQPWLDACDMAAGEASCAFSATDELTRWFGPTESGVVTVVASAGLIERLELDLNLLRRPAVGPDQFRRWAAVRDPDIARSLPLLAWAETVVPLAKAWEAAGRPDLPAPALGGDPVKVVDAFLAARNGGDWESMVALMGGDALADPLGSRDEFEAAQLLERVIDVTDCRVILADTRGSRLACRASVTDIIVRAAGITATNPNDTTFQVLDGRVTGLPDFLPSSFLAETAVEAWAAATVPAAYREACPDGIAGQSPIDGLDCARFIAEQREAWEPLVAALDL